MAARRRRDARSSLPDAIRSLASRAVRRRADCGGAPATRCVDWPCSRAMHAARRLACARRPSLSNQQPLDGGCVVRQRRLFRTENIEALGRPLVAWQQVREGLYRVSGTGLVWSAYAGGLLIVLVFVRSRARAPLLLLFALAGAAALPCSAYMHGHPFRIRYDVPLVAACAALAGAGCRFSRPECVRSRPRHSSPSPSSRPTRSIPHAPMVVESQREAASKAGRRAVSDYLAAHRDGKTIMMSMGSLGHYMQDLSAYGFPSTTSCTKGTAKSGTSRSAKPEGSPVGSYRGKSGRRGRALSETRKPPRISRRLHRVAEGGGAGLYRAK